MARPTTETTDNRKRVLPLGQRGEPWIGTDEGPCPEDPEGYRLIRCVDPCGVVGIWIGSQYLVRADFVHDE